MTASPIAHKRAHMTKADLDTVGSWLTDVAVHRPATPTTTHLPVELRSAVDATHA